MILRRRTHNLFSFATALGLCIDVLRLGIFYASFVSLYYSIAINYLIDSLGGHKGLRRSPTTHSLVGVSLVSIASSIPIIIMVNFLNLSPVFELSLKLIVVSFVVGFTHIFLDMFTADGVYPLWPFTKSKLSLLRVRYDNALMNTSFSIISILIIAYIIYRELYFYVKFLP